MSVSIIIPVFNKWELTQNCLNSINNCANNTEIEIVIVDNASSDQTNMVCELALSQMKISKYQYIRLDKNHNFAKACNIGARASTYEILFFLNNDTIVTDNSIDQLYNTVKHNRKNVVSPILAYPEFAGYKERVQHLGIAIEPRFYPRHLYEGFPLSHPVCKKEHPFQCLTAAALMLHKSNFFEVGLFDERFVNGGEDVALCLKLKQLSCKNVVVSSAKIYHLASQSTGIHDHDRENAKVLKDHYAQYFVPDMHSILVNDGYELSLTPGLNVYVEMPEKRRAILERRIKKTDDINTLEKMILNEPICYLGYKKLIDKYLNNMQYDKLTNVLNLYFKFKLHPDVARYIIMISDKINDNELIKRAKSLLEWYKTSGRYVEIYEIACDVAHFYKANAIESLYNLYNNWLMNRDQYKIYFR